LIRAGFTFAPEERLAFRAAGGLFRGHADGIITAGPELTGVGYPCLWEHKALGDKGWRALECDGLEKAYPRLALPPVPAQEAVPEECVSGALAPIADKLGKCIRLLSSDRDGEVVAAAHAIRRVLQSAGLDVHALADQVENPPGNFNAAEARRLYDTGYMQ